MDNQYKILFALGLVAVGAYAIIRGRKSGASTNNNYTMTPEQAERYMSPRATSRSINKLFVHCAATKEGVDVTTDTIKKWHLARGFNDIGYHYVIYRDGSIHQGRKENVAGAHVSGYNANSIGICYVGGLDSNGNPKDTRTPAQKDAMQALLRALKRRYPTATIYCHRDFSNKACPSFDAKTEYKNL